MKPVIAVLFLALVIFVSGCASVPMADLELDAKAKEFVPAPSKASIYIYRNETFGAAISMAVTVNGLMLGQTAAKSYFLINVPPGSYVIESQAEGVSKLPLSVVYGKNYFVWQEVKMGIFYAGSMLQQVTEDVGRVGVMESKLIATAAVSERIVPMGSSVGSLAPARPSDISTDQRLRDLKTLNESGLINRDVYIDRQREILDGKP